MNARMLLLLGVIVAGTAVGLGALGAHWFETKAQALYTDPELQHKRVEAWKTGAAYQMYHGLALLAVGLCALHTPSLRWDVAAACFLIGVLLFSGSLYTIGLSGVTDWKAASKAWLAVIIATPLGGTFFLLGWATFLWAILGMPTTTPQR
jgi:uncharacterized membrane protein YgdD (TMEM256/DUF423 family)